MSVAASGRATAVALLVLATLAGCAGVPVETTGDDAAGLANGRIGAALRWQAGGSAAADADAQVRALLSQPLDETGAIEVAVVRSRRLQAALAHAVAEAQRARAEAAPADPVLDALVRWPHGSGGPLVDLGLAFGLLDLLRGPGRRDAADLAARAAALDAAVEILRATTEVRLAWTRAVAAQEIERLEADAAEASSIAAELAQRQHTAGTLARLDLVRFQAFAAEAQALLGRSRAETSAARERLVRALGVHGAEANVRLVQHLPRLPHDDATEARDERRAVERRLDLERARVAVLAARLGAGLAEDERTLPDVEAGVSFEREIDGVRSTGPGISVVLPVSPKQGHLAAAAQAAALEAEARLYALAVEVRSEVREARTRLRAAADLARAYEDAIVPLRAAAVEEAQLHYNGMLIGVYDLLVEKREELHARRDLLDARSAAWMARIELDAALGGDRTAPADAPRDAADAAPAPVPAQRAHDHHDHGGR